VFELELVAKSAKEFTSADAQELATAKATGMPVAAVQDLLAAKLAGRSAEALDLLYEMAEGPAEVSICQSQRLRPRRHRKMPERYEDFVTQQSRSMIANPKDGPLSIAVTRVDQTRRTYRGSYVGLQCKSGYISEMVSFRDLVTTDY